MRLTSKYDRIFKKLKAAFLEDVKESGGTHCPCCGQFAKYYKRKLNSAAAIGLIKLHKLDGGYHHVSELDVSRSGGSFALLRHWGLIAPKPNDDSGKRCSGYWKITPSGTLFALNIISVPSHIVIYNNRPIWHAGDMIDIEDALGDKFNYEELMNEC